MRIITGSARGSKLETLEGESTRPTAEMAKEAIFSSLQFEIEGRRVLDLFAGSGQMGLEALSRGAESALLADNNPAAVDIIKKNAKKTHLFEKCNIICTDYKDAIRGARGRGGFDIIFIDPPYASDFAVDAADKLIAAELVNQYGVIVIETGNKLEYLPDGFKVRKSTKYGRAYVLILEKE